MERNEKTSKDDYGAESAGMGMAGYGEVNKSYDEEKLRKPSLTNSLKTMQ